MAITTWNATTGDWDDSEFDRAWDGPSISPAVGSLSTTLSIPTLKVAYSISPDKADIELVQSYEWDQLTTTWVTTPGTWESGPVPQVAVGADISPANADLTLVTYAPSQGVIYTFPIDKGDLTLTGKVPFAGLGATISPDKGDLEIVQTYSWENYGGTWADAGTDWAYVPFVPDAVEEGKNQPAVAELTLTGQIPIAAESIGFPVGKADLTLSSTAPPHGISHFRSPAKADLIGLGTTSWADTSGDWNSNSDSWGEGTLSPIPGVTYKFPIDSADMLLDGSEISWPYVGQPKYKPQVIMA